MTILAKYGDFLVQSSDIVGTTIAETGFGFQPDLIFFFWSGRGEAVDTLGRANGNPGWGYASAVADRRFVNSSSEDGVGTSNTDKQSRDTACVGTITIPGGTIGGLLDLSSIDADGFTVIVDDQFPTDLRVGYLALGGTSITNITSGIFQMSGALGTQDITGLGFQPDAVYFLDVGTSGGLPNLSSTMEVVAGSMISGTQQGYLTIADRNGQGTMQTATSALDAAEARAGLSGGGGIPGRFKFDSMLADGFRIDNTEADNDRVQFIAIKGGDFAIGQLLTRTDGADIVVSGLGFEPSGVIFWSGTNPENVPDASTADATWSVGAASSPTERGAFGFQSLDGLATSEVATALEFDAVYIKATRVAAPAIDGLMDLKSLDADGFTCVMDNPDPSANFVLWWAFGPAAAAVPADPSDLACVTISSSRIDLTWTDNSTDETGFRIERAPTAVGPWSTAGTVGPNVTSFSDMGLAASTEFFYRVFAFNASGDSGPSNVVSCTTDPTPPGPGRHEPGSWLKRYLAGRILGGRRLGDWLS